MRFDNASTVVYYCLIQMNIINLGILAHIDAGKTSVTENLLFACGATEKRGSVDKGDTITDSMDIEKRRGITIRASTTSIVWNGVKCNIIDTPGHMDFIAEVERTFKMLDGAVLILSAKEGIYYGASMVQIFIGMAVLLACAVLALFILKGLNRKAK